MPKHALRTSILKKRQALDHATAVVKSERICRLLTTHPWFVEAATVALYWSIRNEVATAPILDWLKNEGKRIALPRIKGDLLEFSPFEGRESLQLGAFKVPEPVATTTLSLEEFDLIVVPGVVFDRTGHRLGYGRGYYDRVLAELPDSVRSIGLAYDFQVVDSIITEAHDCPVDLVLTDNGVLN